MISNKGTSLVEINGLFASAIPLNTMHIGLFKGAVPRLEDALVVTPGTPNSTLISLATAFTNMGIVQANYLGSIVCPAITPVINVDARTVTLPLSTLSQSVLGLAGGTPTYFVLRQCSVAAAAQTWAGFNSTGYINNLIIGTVGTDSSDAELRFIGGNIVAGQTYRLLDLNFQL